MTEDDNEDEICADFHEGGVVDELLGKYLEVLFLHMLKLGFENFVMI